MNDIEINSDRTTVIVACLILASALFALVYNLYGLLSHSAIVSSQSAFEVYLPAAFNTYLTVVLCRDRQLRKTYPYGIIGTCLFSVGLLVMAAIYRTKPSAEALNLLSPPLHLINVIASTLILFEGGRWFKKIVRLSR